MSGYHSGISVSVPFRALRPVSPVLQLRARRWAIMLERAVKHVRIGVVRDRVSPSPTQPWGKSQTIPFSTATHAVPAAQDRVTQAPWSQTSNWWALPGVQRNAPSVQDVARQRFRMSRSAVGGSQTPEQHWFPRVHCVMSGLHVSASAPPCVMAIAPVPAKTPSADFTRSRRLFRDASTRESMSNR